MDLELSRRLTAHPRGPRAPDGDVLLVDEAAGGFPRIIDDRGLVWEQDGGGWRLDLGHRATAGVLLAELPDFCTALVSRTATVVRNAYSGVVIAGEKTTGEAVARALLAVWGA